jgi:hypothetical protein
MFMEGPCGLFSHEECSEVGIEDMEWVSGKNMGVKAGVDGIAIFQVR